MVPVPASMATPPVVTMAALPGSRWLSTTPSAAVSLAIRVRLPLSVVTPSAVAPPIPVSVPGNPAPGAAALGVPAATNPGAAALGVPAMGANDPRVISFDEETYICKPNDTLASICRSGFFPVRS